jgi:hypothetical protein
MIAPAVSSLKKIGVGNGGRLLAIGAGVCVTRHEVNEEVIYEIL